MFFSLALPTLDTFTDVSVRLFREALLCLEVFDTPVGLMFSLFTVPIMPWKGFLRDLSVAAERPGEKVAVFLPVLCYCYWSFCLPVFERDLMAAVPETRLVGREFVHRFGN